MSAATGQATAVSNSPRPGMNCNSCAETVHDADLDLDVTEATEEATETSEDVDAELSKAEIGAAFLGKDVDATAELKQAANGKRVVKVLSSIGIGVVILNEIFSIDSIANGSGPFSGVVGTIETTGVAALTLLVVGLIAYAGAVAMGYLDMF